MHAIKQQTKQPQQPQIQQQALPPQFGLDQLPGEHDEYIPWTPLYERTFNDVTNADIEQLVSLELPRLHSLWNQLEISFARRRTFDEAVSTLPVDMVLERVQAECERLQKLLPLMGDEMAQVTRREKMKQLIKNRVIHGDDAAALVQELERLTAKIVAKLEKWELQHKLTFVYRGVSYIRIINEDRNGSQ